MQRYLTMLLLMLVSLTLVPAAPAQAEPRCFPEAAPVIVDCIDGRLRTFWEEQGGLPVFGYPLSPAREQETDNGTITVQLFERARLEVHPENAPPYDVLLGRLGADDLAQRQPSPPPADQPREGCLFFDQTQQNICSPFLATWRSYGLELGDAGISAAESLALFGLPISPAQSATLDDGATYTVQWFERARFEDHGDAGILLGLLGRELTATADPQPATPDQPEEQPQPPDADTTSLPPGGFIEVSGAYLTRLGQPVTIKGANYYPQWRPWANMWGNWDAHQMQRELQVAHEHLGLNAIRILLPYEFSKDLAVKRLKELVQIAGDLDMRVLVTLFDFSNSFPEPGSPGEWKHLEYLRDIVGNFAGDDRILGWDIHNEPDHYDFWLEGNAPQVLSWLGRMADEVHHLAPNHLVTVGMGQYDHLWQAGPDGRRVIDYSDVISVHNYNAEDTARQLFELRQYTDKPILLQEFGWPSGPRCSTSAYNEEQQAAVYQTMLDASLATDANDQPYTAGVFAWSLRDFDSGPTLRWDTREEHYGLFRIDDSLKPAALLFREYPRWSATQRNQEQSTADPRWQLWHSRWPIRPQTVRGQPILCQRLVSPCLGRIWWPRHLWAPPRRSICSAQRWSCGTIL
ncbi:MAG: cellulase family glycosylhydrolase [Chloroflexaceae bacterium]|nr:cellulase family glycosylhydrolase [Chloroflexaceae bacterium]